MFRRAGALYKYLTTARPSFFPSCVLFSHLTLLLLLLTKFTNISFGGFLYFLPVSISNFELVTHDSQVAAVVEP